MGYGLLISTDCSHYRSIIERGRKPLFYSTIAVVKTMGYSNIE